MFDAAVSMARTSFPPRVQLNFDPPFHLGLIAPAILLALLKKWAGLIAPVYGVYFTAEVATIVYAYFALSRAVYVHNNGRGADGRRDKARMRKAEQEFHRALKAGGGPRFLAVAIPLAAVAAGADLLTMGRQLKVSNACYGLILLVEILVWLRIGPPFVVACAKWNALKPYRIELARQLVWRNAGYVWPSFLLATLLFAVGATLALFIAYPPLRALVVAVLPTWHAIFWYSTAFYSVIAVYALAIQCVWSELVGAPLRDTGPEMPVFPEPRA